MKPAFLPRLLLALSLPLAGLLSPPTAFAAAPAPVAGRDYTVIADPRPFAPANGKVEVVEVFGYPCPHCAHFEPVLDAWKRRQPADIRFTAVPAPFGGYWLAYARVYYAAEQLGVLGRLHQAIFDALHVEHSLPVQNVSPDELATFFASHGVDRQRFIAALRGAEVDARLAQARDFAIRAGIEGTPSMVVAGKYTVTTEGGFEKMLQTVDWLVAQERAAAKKSAR